MQEIGNWKDKWLLHPFPNMSEPEKAICYLTQTIFLAVSSDFCHFTTYHFSFSC